jgi:hypothetical protein
MERSRYFGFSKDLYHFDHFLVRTCLSMQLSVPLVSYCSALAKKFQRTVIDF